MLKSSIQANKDEVRIFIPDMGLSDCFKGIVLVDKNGSIMAVGQTEEEIKKSSLDQAQGVSERDYKSYKKLYAGFENISFDRFKSMSSMQIWDMMRSQFNFIYPFDCENLQPKIVILTLCYACLKLVSQHKKPSLFVQLFGVQYSFDLNISGYENLYDRRRDDFERELLSNSKIFKIKELRVNGKRLN